MVLGKDTATIDYRANVTLRKLYNLWPNQSHYMRRGFCTLVLFICDKNVNLWLNLKPCTIFSGPELCLNGTSMAVFRNDMKHKRKYDAHVHFRFQFAYIMCTMREY